MCISSVLVLFFHFIAMLIECFSISFMLLTIDLVIVIVVRFFSYSARLYFVHFFAFFFVRSFFRIERIARMKWKKNKQKKAATIQRKICLHRTFQVLESVRMVETNNKQQENLKKLYSAFCTHKYFSLCDFSDMTLITFNYGSVCFFFFFIRLLLFAVSLGNKSYCWALR